LLRRWIEPEPMPECWRAVVRGLLPGGHCDPLERCSQEYFRAPEAAFERERVRYHVDAHEPMKRCFQMDSTPLVPATGLATANLKACRGFRHWQDDRHEPE
jgi:hypothetical protein